MRLVYRITRYLYGVELDVLGWKLILRTYYAWKLVLGLGKKQNMIFFFVKLYADHCTHIS